MTKKIVNEAEPELKEDGAEEEEEECEEKMAKKAKKSDDLSEDDLQKSIDKLEEYAEKGDTVTRKQSLLAKAQSDELDKSEQAELFKLLGGVEPEKSELAEEVVKGMEGNDNLQKALDVSEYLQEQHTELTKSLTTLGEYIEKSDTRQQGFNLVLARAIAQTGKLAKSIDTRLGALETQPVRGPKSKGVHSLEKAFVGQAPAAGEGSELSKSQILDAMDEMMVKSMGEGRGGATEDGISLDVAVSQFEQFNKINPRLLAQVQAHVKRASSN